MNQQAHWDKIGGRYDGEIFDVFKSDKKGNLADYFKKHANPAHRAIDFGCGMGKAFPFLAPAFETVLAIDISGELLSIAKLSPYSNITYKRADLTGRNLVFPLSHFVFCCNLIMLPELRKNAVMIENIYKALHAQGTAIVVMPSLESVLFSSWRLIDWYIKEGVDPSDIPQSEFSYFKAPKRDIVQGIIYIDDVPTKHFLEAEIRLLFEKANLTITTLDKIEYDWDSEFAEPPSWMKAPYPWDWLIECKKQK